MFGISAPRMAVRAAIPWYWRWVGLIALALAILLLARVTYDSGKKFAGFDQGEANQEVRRLAESNAKMQQELAQLLIAGGAVPPRIYSTFANQAYLAVVEKPEAMAEIGIGQVGPERILLG